MEVVLLLHLQLIKQRKRLRWDQVVVAVSSFFSFSSYLFFFFIFLASKKGGATNVPAASGIAGNAKAGPVQVFLNGKIVTPQSLLPRKAGQSHHGKKPKANFTKPQAIDENMSESAEKPAAGFASKLNMKRSESFLLFFL
jgi:hypothetical protein